MILVAGSTGMVGSEICRLLGEKGLPFRALVRGTSDPAKVERVKSYGAEIVVGDLRNRESLAEACQGVDAVICTVSAMPFSYLAGENNMEKVDQDGVIGLIDAARAAGVKQFIHTTFSANMNLDFPLGNAKRAAEKHLQKSGMAYTILRPSFFMEAWLSPMVGFDAANAKATIYGSGDQPIAWISYKDVAKFAVESLENPAAKNCALEMGGPEMLSPHQVVRIYEKIAGKPFEVAHVPAEVLQGQFDGAVDPMQKSFVALMLCYASGDPIDMSELQKTFFTRLTPLKEHITAVMA